MEWTIISCGPIFRLKRQTSDTWKSVQLRCSEESSNRSPWENNHKSELVKPILMKPMVLDQEHTRIPL